MHLLHDLRVGKIRHRRPRFQLLRDLLQDIDAAALQLRAGAPVEHQPLTGP